MSKKSPQLRFEGFTDDWEERKLGDITKISTGKLDANAMVENGKYDFYTSGIKKYRIDVAAFEGPSITIAGNGATVGYMHLADNKFNAYQRTYVLQEFLVDRSFIFSEIGNKLPKKIKQEARTGNIPYIVMDMLTELKVSIPQNDTEQKKIGDFFKQLDDTIALHQHKLDLLKEQKKGYLQKMFPKNGEKVPELRFAGFADDWEDRKLGEISKYSNGGSYENDVVENGTYELITLKSVNMSGKLVSSGKFINRETKTLEKDTLVMILSEQAPGLLGMTAQIPENNKYVLNQRVAEIKPNTNIDSYFLSMSINRSQVYFSKRGAGTKVQNISKPNVENFEFYCPSEREQQKIDSFFKQVDNTIDLHQHKLDLLKEQKKGFLQKMFV
ncbi:restriction endonuclease subunit S [Lactococcus garvieae]|uniref:HsdS n=1 Tax=Lactococcus garvieae TaxID=1363 RepID=A0A0D4CBR5_9LACT|nr:HsdS [Lactococcus garvieae]EIT66748.1 HsdS subunit [Lactococcus garvieae IPLA 31405]